MEELVLVGDLEAWAWPHRVVCGVEDGYDKEQAAQHVRDDQRDEEELGSVHEPVRQRVWTP